jgi:hypothetical protein
MKNAVTRLLWRRAVVGALAIAGAAIALSSPARATAVDMSTNIRLSAMGPPATCQGVVCPTAYGAVTVIGNTDSSLTYTITLTPGVSFLGAGDVFYFDLTTNGGGTFNFTDVSPGYSAPYWEVILPARISLEPIIMP